MTLTPPIGIHGVLSVLADVAETATPTRRSSPIPEPFGWVNLSPVILLGLDSPFASVLPWAYQDLLQVMAAIDAIRPGEPSLRLGWLWVAGSTPDAGGEPRRVFEPLLTLPVSVKGLSLKGIGETQLTPLISNHDDRLQLEGRMWQALGGGAFDYMGPEVPAALLPRLHVLGAFAKQAATAAGLNAARLVPARASPAVLAGAQGLRIVVGLGLYATDSEPDFSAAGSLRLWHERVGTTWTALHALYLDRPAPPVAPQPDLPSPLRLTVAQHACVAEARRAPVTVISGAPGTGKTHTIAAIIGDAVAGGRSVLVAAKSEATVQAIVELLGTQPGPDPVVFGARYLRTDLARRLAAGEPASVPAATVDHGRDVMRRAVADRDLLWRGIADTLKGMSVIGDGPRARALRQRLPGLSRPGVDLFEIQRLAQRTGVVPPPWWQIADRRRWARLLDLLGVVDPPNPTDLASASSLATAVRAMHEATNPLTGVLDWPLLVQAQHRVEHVTGQWMDATARDERRLTRSVRASRAALATALRAGRARRRGLLAQLGTDVPRALPVWVGTLGDIDDLLPMTPGIFDLVVLDEASSIDQPRAATALLRGRRAVVVGDPQQLRHVSFVSDRVVQEALHRHLPGAPAGLAARLDVRQNSLFDVAAGAAPVRRLDEHFRSAPHLFAFVGRELYRDTVRVATLTPANDAVDLIAVTRLDASRSTGQVVADEVVWVMQRLAQLREEGARSVGVVSPFRAQADAIEAAALAELAPEDIKDLGLRVGTVHAFQGMERDVVLVSLGVGREDGAGTWRFAANPNLFAVMATRARDRIEWVISASPPHGSLIAAYLDQVDRPPRPQRGVAEDCPPWTREVAGHLGGLEGLQVTAPYVAGRHRLDLCLAEGPRHLAVETTLHPEGPHPHIRRHVELARNGWPILSAFSAVWADRPAELALRLRRALAEQPPSPPPHRSPGPAAVTR